MSNKNQTDRPKPVVLAILDGWGIAPAGQSNAISQAKTPFFDQLIANYPVMTLAASAESVGLPWGEMGNSEVGHSTIGTGLILYQNFPRITKSIWDGDFFTKPALIQACERVKKNNSSLHLLGMISSGGVHSYIEHLYALLELAKRHKVDRVYIHCFLDGRDMTYNAGLDLVKRLQERMKSLKVGEIASIIGRYYAMDRDNRWDRTEKTYRMLTEGIADYYFQKPVEAIEEIYQKKIYDEEFPAVIIGEAGKPTAIIQDEDAVIFFNFRSDRARQLTKAFVLPGFAKFERKEFFKDLYFVTMVEYAKDLPCEIVFASQTYKTCLAKAVSEAGLNQLHIAETEKYAHVTYFFNGGREKPFPGEDQVLISSPQVATYDQEPEMSALKISERVVEDIKKNKYDFIIINFANPDMVAHTGDMQATIKAIETIDKALEEVVTTVLGQDGVIFIGADHGNAEEIYNLQTGEMDKEHSTNPVPFIAISKTWQGQVNDKARAFNNDLSLLPPQGVLADIAPTILRIMQLPIPEIMIGRPLV